EGEAVVDLGDEGVGEAEGLTADHRAVEKAHSLELVIEVEAAGAADETGVGPGAAKGGPGAVEHGAGDALPAGDERGRELLDAAESEERDPAVGGEAVVAGMRVGVVDAVAEQRDETCAVDSGGRAVAGAGGRGGGEAVEVGAV